MNNKEYQAEIEDLEPAPDSPEGESGADLEETSDAGRSAAGRVDGPREDGVDEFATDEPPRQSAEGVDDASAEEAELNELLERSELDVALAERDEYLDSLRRLQAEFDNYRKRMVRQQSELLEHAAESLIERLLPVLDALDLAIAHSDSTEGGPADLESALKQIGALCRDTLAREGLQRIDAAGVPFDPTVHDAVAHLPRTDEDEPHEVLVEEVLRAGYQLKGRILRPAMVRVRG